MLKLSIQEEMEINCTEIGEILQRGRLYERYREKREAKLREEWFLKMEGKEAEMQTMWESFERAKSSSSHQECESRLSNVRLHLSASQEMKNSVQEKKKTKAAASRNGSMKRSDVDRSSFSMLLTTKENRAPLPKDRPNTSSSMSSQRSLSRSRTITEEQKNRKPVKSHHRRNSLAGPVEFGGLELDNNLDVDSSGSGKSLVGKSFLRKGSGIGPGAGAAIAKQRSSIGSEQRDTEISSQSSHLTLSQELLTDFLVLGSSWNEELKEAQSVVRARERKKWGIPEKAPQIFSG